MQNNAEKSISSDLQPRKLGVNNVAKRLGLSPRMVRHLAERGVLRAYKEGIKTWRFVSTDVDEFRVLRDRKHD